MLYLIFTHVDYTALQQNKRRYSIFIFICNKIRYRVRISIISQKPNRYSCGDILIIGRGYLLTSGPRGYVPMLLGYIHELNNEKSVENHSLKDTETCNSEPQ